MASLGFHRQRGLGQLDVADQPEHGPSPFGAGGWQAAGWGGAFYRPLPVMPDQPEAAHFFRSEDWLRLNGYFPLITHPLFDGESQGAGFGFHELNVGFESFHREAGRLPAPVISVVGIRGWTDGVRGWQGFKFPRRIVVSGLVAKCGNQVQGTDAVGERCSG
jgi:hypothetical protein